MTEPRFKIGDQVVVLDGSGIKDYIGGFIPDMRRYVGNTHTVIDVFEERPPAMYSYRLANCQDYFFDERGLAVLVLSPEEELNSSPYMDDIFNMYNTLNGCEP